MISSPHSQQSNFIPLIAKFALLLSFILLFSSWGSATTYYVNSSGGNDANTGLAPESAWKTINKTNSTVFINGSIIRFACDATWRMPDDAWLNPSWGSASGNVTYTSYGECNGRKPLLLGSNLSTTTSEWRDLGGNKWNYISNRYDIANLVFPNGSIGIMNFTFGAIDGQGDFFCNRTTHNTTLYSVGNPVTFYGSIEVVPAHSIIEASDGFGKSNLVIQGLELKYTGDHGINIVDGKNIYLLNNTISYIGGRNTGTTVREGNGIQFYRGSTFGYASYNNVSQCYDDGLTYQASSGGGAFTAGNITFSYNIVSNCELGFNLFQDHATSRLHNLTIIQNTFADGGIHIFDKQHIDTIHGRCIRFGTAYNVSGVKFWDNICYGAEQYVYGAFSIPYSYWQGEANLSMNYNLLWRNLSSGLTTDFALFTPLSQTYATLAQWQTNTTKDANSVFALPLFLPNSYTPSSNSPACTMSSNGSYVGALPCSGTPSDTTSPCSVLFNETSPLVYPSLFKVYTDCTTNFTIRRGTTVVSNNSVQNLTVGTYVFTVNRSDTFNYSIVFDSETFQIRNTAEVEAIENFTPKLKQSILEIVDWFPVFIIIIIGGLIYAGFVAFKNRENFDMGNLDLSNIDKLLIGLFICMLLIVITLVMIRSMGG